MKNNYLKGGLFALMMIAGTAVQAQTITPTDAGLSNGAGDGVSVKLIDNKGTIKYLQTNNGITSITSTTSGSATTTTWQLGGTLTDDTYIDVEANVFALDGIELVDTSALAASLDATDQSDHGTGTGWTLLVRDEVTGAIKKLAAANLVEAATADDVAILAEETLNEIVITATAIPTAASLRGKIWVFRNGAKLSSLSDYTISADIVTVRGTTDFNIYAGDVFEVQWVK